jgi:hypothetical protein
MAFEALFLGAKLSQSTAAMALAGDIAGRSRQCRSL